MKRHLLFSVVFIFSAVLLFGQETVVDDTYLSKNNYPEGIYLTFDDFINKEPSINKRVEARDIFRPKNVIHDPLIDNCYFYDRRSKKRIKEAFAISFGGSLFFHVKSMQKRMSKKDRKQRIEFKDSFIRVVDQGEYLYMEGFVIKGGGLGFGIGSGPISIGTGGPKEAQTGIVFDFQKNQFDLFRDCKDFNAFLSLKHRDKTFKCERKDPPLEIIREIIAEIN